MKASEFVAQIQALIAEHGDLEVQCYTYWAEGQVAEANASVRLVDGVNCIVVLDE